MAACPSDETVALFLQGGLSQSHAAELRRHLDGCEACRALIADAARAGSGSRSDGSGSASSESGRRESPSLGMESLILSPGALVGGKYVIESSLGAGGMGMVYRARHVELDRLVAIKVLHEELANDASAVKRISREARATAALTSPNTVRVLDIDRLETGAPYLVMELLEGRDLGVVLAEEGPFGFDRAIDVMLQATNALVEAHDHGVVHRDLKPSNLFLTTDGTIKVLDFGLAKRLPLGKQKDSGDTRTKSLVGSPLYMAPEQIRSAKTVDARADIWSVGVTLYNLLTGALPFAAASIYVLCSRILTDAPRPLEERRPGVPAALANVVARCLEKAPDRRYPDARALAAALREAHERLDAPPDTERIDETIELPGGQTQTLESHPRTPVMPSRGDTDTDTDADTAPSRTPRMVRR